jgi:hypothetical protein
MSFRDFLDITGPLDIRTRGRKAKQKPRHDFGEQGRAVFAGILSQ